MELMFWILFGIFIYTYIGYPLMLFFIGFLPVRKEIHINGELPKVSLIIAAYNEEKSIKAKLENSLRLDYPKDLLEIIVVSDCSNDRTERAVGEYRDKHVRLLTLATRSGKTVAQNEGAKIAGGDILVFSDATTMYKEDALNKIMPHFNDERIGCVGGRLIFVDSAAADNAITQKNIYERLEEFIRTRETNFRTTFGIDGCLYAVRKDLYRPLDGDLTSDFVMPLMLLKDGYRIVFEKSAIAYEESPIEYRYELKRKIRTVRVGITGLSYMRALLNPLKYGLWIPFGLISHKVLRWASPFLLMGLVALNLFLLNKSFYINVLLIQAFIYSLAAAGYVYRRRKIPRVFSIPLYFCLLNISAFLGFIEFLKGKRTEIWDTVRV